MKSARILITEDEGIVALDLSHRLTDAGYEVVDVVDNGIDAIAACVAGSVDLVLMDIRIRGDLDGIETSREIRRHSDVPIVFLTAYSDPATIEHAADVQPAGYVVKPLEDRQLLTTVEVALRCSERQQSDRNMRKDPTGELFHNKLKEGIMCVCADCKRVQSEHEDWEPLPVYLQRHGGPEVSHSFCPSCAANFLRKLPRDDD